MNIYQSGLWSVVCLLAPLLGSYIQEYMGWRYSFGFLALIGVIACWWFRYFIDEHKRPTTKLNIKTIVQDYYQIIHHPESWPTMVIMMVNGSTLLALTVFTPFYLQVSLGLSTIQYGWSVFVIAMGFIIGIIINRLLIGRYSNAQFLRAGVMISVFACLELFILGLFVIQNVFLFLLTLAMMQFGSAFTFPSSMANVLRLFPEKAAKTAGLIGVCNFSAIALVSLIMSWLPHHVLLPISLLYLVLATILYIAFRYSIRLGQTSSRTGSF